jgi:hypothetical protein
MGHPSSWGDFMPAVVSLLKNLRQTWVHATVVSSPGCAVTAARSTLPVPAVQDHALWIGFGGCCARRACHRQGCQHAIWHAEGSRGSSGAFCLQRTYLVRLLALLVYSMPSVMAWWPHHGRCEGGCRWRRGQPQLDGRTARHGCIDSPPSAGRLSTEASCKVHGAPGQVAPP